MEEERGMDEVEERERGEEGRINDHPDCVAHGLQSLCSCCPERPRGPLGSSAERCASLQTPGCEDSADCRWSAVSWDALALPDPEAVSADPPGAARPTCDSRPSSGFYSVSGSSLSASCGSVCSEGPGGPWARRPHSADHSAAQWPGARLQPAPLQQTRPERGERRPVSTGDLEILRGFLSLSDLCPGLGGRSPGSPSTSSHRPPASFCWDPRFPLDPKFCSDLVSRKTKEVYPYPSPLHAVALQSPLYAPCGASNPEPDEGGGGEEVPRCPCGPSPPDPPGPARADRYIGQLLRRYRRRPGSVLLSALDPGPAGRWQAKSLSLSSVCSGSTSSTLTGGALPSVPSLGSLGSSGSTPQAVWGGRRWVPSPAEDEEGRSDRGGSLRGLGGDGLYRGKHYSRVLVRAATLVRKSFEDVHSKTHSREAL
nr:PREDICTED: dapper homolog 2-like [Lepisosteus oculatus]